MKILYFAWIREKTGLSQEDLSPPAEVTTVGDLVGWLRDRGPNFEAAFADETVVRVAVNQEYVTLDHAVSTNDEVAFFPPVTGG